MGPLQGLCLAWNIGIRQLQADVDSICVTQLVVTQFVLGQMRMHHLSGASRIC